MNSIRKSKDLFFLLILTLVGAIFAFIIIAKAESTYSYISSLSEESIDSLSIRNEVYTQKTKQ